MTAGPWPPGLPEGDRVQHDWACSRPPAEDAYVVGKDGKPHVIKRCPGCGATERDTPPRRST